MDKNIVRSAMLALVLVCSWQTIPAEALGLSSVTHSLKSFIARTAGMCDDVSRPLSILVAAEAVFVGSLWLYNRFFYRPQIDAPSQAPDSQNPAVKKPSFLCRVLNWFKKQPQVVPAAIQAPAPDSPPVPPVPVQSNPQVPPTQPNSLAEQIMMPAEGYQPATDEQLATVPYFNDPNNLVVEPLQFQSQHDGAQVIVQQVLTSTQIGGQTCAYECIKNGSGCIGLTRGLSGHHLLTAEAAKELFGVNPPGIFRQSINRSRKKASLNDLWLTRLIVRPEPLPDETRETVANYRNEYQTLLRRFLNEQIDTLERTNQTTFTIDAIKTYIAQAPIVNRYAGALDRTQQQIDNLYQTMVEYIRNPQNIARYINIPNEIHLTDEYLNNAIQNLNTARPQAQQIPTNGENLESEEIARLYAQERAQPNSAIGQAIGDIQVITLPSTETPAPIPGGYAINPLETNEDVVNLQHAIAERRLPQNGRICAFSLCSADQGTGTAGHWISLILEMCNNSRRYTIADSMNSIQLFGGPAATVIQFLEGQRLTRPPALMQQIVTQLGCLTMDCELLLKQLDDGVQNYQRSFGHLNELPPALQGRIQRLLGHRMPPPPSSGETTNALAQRPNTPPPSGQNKTQQLPGTPSSKTI